MTGLGQLAERFGTDLGQFCGRHRHRRARHHHRRQHHDRAGRRRRRAARHRGPPRRDRDAPGPQGADLGPVLPGAVRRSPAAAPRIPIPERRRLHGRGAAGRSTRTRSGPAIRRLRQLGAESLAVMFLFSFVNPAHERRAARARSSRSTPRSATSRSATRSCRAGPSSSGRRPRWSTPTSRPSVELREPPRASACATPATRASC